MVIKKFRRKETRVNEMEETIKINFIFSFTFFVHPAALLLTQHLTHPPTSVIMWQDKKCGKMSADFVP